MFAIARRQAIAGNQASCLFSTTTANRVDMLDFVSSSLQKLKFKKDKTPKKEATTNTNTEIDSTDGSVVEEVTAISESSSILPPVNPNKKFIYLSAQNKIDDSKKEVFEINKWKAEALTSTEDLSFKLSEIYSQVYGQELPNNNLRDARLDDLLLRFKYIKEVQRQTGIDVPDFVLSKAHSADQIGTYLAEAITSPKFNEKTPNAIHLKQEDFNDTKNVFIADGAF